MANPRGASSFVLLATLLVACEGGPTAPSPVAPTPVTRVAITVTLLESYPDTASVPGVTVTCLAGCQNQTVGTTDNSGQTTLTGVEPLTVRAEKDGYISVEKQVSDGDNIVLKREPVAVTITVVDTYPDTTSVLGVTVTCLAGCQNQTVGTTDNSGQTTLTGVKPLTVRAEKDGYISVEQQVSNGDTIILQREPVVVTITVELPYPEDDYNIRVGISEATVACLTGCEGQPTEVTDRQGEVTFIGRLPLTIRAEKLGHISVEQQTYGGRVNLGHEWPVELRESIRQLNLADAIATGELFLIWGDREYIDADGWGQFSCPVIIIKQILDRNFMLAILAHENMHAWQGRRSNNPPCDLHYGYPPTEEARSWKEAWEQDVEEHGPYPGVDDSDWASTLLENQAGIYGHWYWGPETELLVEPAAWADKKAALEKLYRLAPNRCQYLESRFGPPPSR